MRGPAVDGRDVRAVPGAIIRETMKLLLIEDDREAAHYVARRLTGSGYTVDHAADGAEGLALAAGAIDWPSKTAIVIAERDAAYPDFDRQQFKSDLRRRR